MKEKLTNYTNHIITIKQFGNLLGLKNWKSVKREYNLHLELVGKRPPMKLTEHDYKKIYP